MGLKTGPSSLTCSVPCTSWYIETLCTSGLLWILSSFCSCSFKWWSYVQSGLIC